MSSSSKESQQVPTRTGASQHKPDQHVPTHQPSGAQTPDSEIPPSERGKEEEMPLERREPSAVFGLVAGSYLVILIISLLVIAAVIWWLM